MDKTLFTIQFGKKKDKVKLVSNILKTNKESVTLILGKGVNATPCTYLFRLGLVKDLKEELHISDDFDDDDVVYKFGRTIDLKERAQKHHTEYGQFNGVEVCLELYAWIDPRYLAEAENMIKSFMSTNNYNIKSSESSYTELVAIPSKSMRKIKKLYTDIAEKYSGLLSDMRNENSSIKKELDYTKTIIDSKDDNINNLKDNISNLKDNLKTKDEMIKMLQEKLKKSKK